MDASVEELPHTITTPRLTLRRWEVGDAPALHDAVNASLEHLRPWMEWIQFEPLTVSDREELIRSWDRAWEDSGDAIYGVFHQGQVIGGSGFHHRIGPGALEIGYWVHAGHVRQGYATELARGLTEAACGLATIDRVEIRHDKANLPSGLVAKALGYRLIREEEDEIKAPAESGVSCVWEFRATEAD